MSPARADLRRHAVARTLSAPTPLPRAVARLGFVPADPLLVNDAAPDEELQRPTSSRAPR